ncbi:hypothetical protein LUZ60_014251 [Juncus effusus]|nr:hypothetical protein LUZ60_014251 [Juncus effusus]
MAGTREGEEELNMSEETLARVFAQLKPYSIDLLDLLQNPRRRKTAAAAASLSELTAFLRRAPSAVLQPCFDYTLFPLLMLLDASVQCRKGKTVNSVESLSNLEVSDSVSEGVLKCLETLLSKCPLSSVNQMIMVLKKLTSAAMLSHTEASEEFRTGTIKSFKAMILNIKPCSNNNNSCISCEKLLVPDTIVPIIGTGSEMRFRTDSDACLVGFLQSGEASPAVGHWLSLLLQTAEVEASRGHNGSSVLRKEAFLTLRILISKVGTADALAFFLPGIVSKISKPLYTSKTVLSGPSGSSASLEQAILALTEALTVVLSDHQNLPGLGPPRTREIPSSTESVLDMLRKLTDEVKSDGDSVRGLGPPWTGENGEGDGRQLVVKRSKEWIEQTGNNVDKMLQANFPHLSVHRSERVRKAVADGIKLLLSNCNQTLKQSKLMLLECLCVLACDESPIVSESAQDSLNSLFSRGESFLTEPEISDIFTRLVDKLPKVILGSEETVSVSHAKRLLALTFYAGPDFLINHLISSPANSTRFFDSISVSLNPNSQFSGSFSNLILSKPLSAGYLHSIAELKSGTRFNRSIINSTNGTERVPVTEIGNSNPGFGIGNWSSGFELPRVPPWFVGTNGEKLYGAVAGVLRLVGLSTIASKSGQKSSVNLSILIDILLDQFRKFTSQIRTKHFNNSGQITRETSVSVCIISEIIFGLSPQSLHSLSEIFKEKGNNKWCLKEGFNYGKDDIVVQCIGSVLNEYLSNEVWDPLVSEYELEFSLSFIRDITTLHQVIIEGIGIFSMVLGRDFTTSGFMQSSLYLLLRNLISSENQIRIASDSVLRVLAASSGHISVGEMVVRNGDYIVDSLCRQLRHLDMNRDVPAVLSSMLSFIGTAQHILPLLEEPMRAVSLELEVLGRQERPHLTVPFLKAVCEISKACKSESLDLPKESELFYENVISKVSTIEKFITKNDEKSDKVDITNEEYYNIDFWEEKLIKLNEIKRYRRIIGSLAESCLKSSVPLLSSLSDSISLLSLDIIENAVESIGNVESAHKTERKSKAGIMKAIDLLAFNEMNEDAREEDESDENRLLPAMNRLWPFLIICLKNKISVAVVKKCTKVITKSVQISGGDFFVRRFHTDGPHIFHLLTLSPFHRNPNSTDQTLILLPYRPNPNSQQTPISEISSVKIQMAVLDMIFDLVCDKRSKIALESVLKRVSGLVVGIACGNNNNSNKFGLRESALRALIGLMNIDEDLLWLLVADLYYSLNRNNNNDNMKLGSEWCGIEMLVPVPKDSKEFLCVQYGKWSSGFELDPSAVEFVFKRIQEGVGKYVVDK